MLDSSFDHYKELCSAAADLDIKALERLLYPTTQKQRLDEENVGPDALRRQPCPIMSALVASNKNHILHKAACDGFIDIVKILLEIPDVQAQLILDHPELKISVDDQAQELSITKFLQDKIELNTQSSAPSKAYLPSWTLKVVTSNEPTPPAEDQDLSFFHVELSK